MASFAIPVCRTLPSCQKRCVTFRFLACAGLPEMGSLLWSPTVHLPSICVSSFPLTRGSALQSFHRECTPVERWDQPLRLILFTDHPPVLNREGTVAGLQARPSHIVGHLSGTERPLFDSPPPSMLVAPSNMSAHLQDVR
jgi:hypothetical protein